LQCGTISHKIFRFAKRPDDITRSAAVKQKFLKMKFWKTARWERQKVPTIQDEGFADEGLRE
jgi:hypothetical protein